MKGEVLGEERLKGDTAESADTSNRGTVKCQVGSVPRGSLFSRVLFWQPTVRGWGQIRRAFNGGCQYQGRLSKRGGPDGTSRRHVEDPSVSTKDKVPFWSVGN